MQIGVGSSIGLIALDRANNRCEDRAICLERERTHAGGCPQKLLRCKDPLMQANFNMKNIIIDKTPREGQSISELAFEFEKIEALNSSKTSIGACRSREPKIRRANR